MKWRKPNEQKIKIKCEKKETKKDKWNVLLGVKWNVCFVVVVFFSLLRFHCRLSLCVYMIKYWIKESWFPKQNENEKKKCQHDRAQMPQNIGVKE